MDQNVNSVQVPLGAIAVVQGHVRLGKVGTTQNARQRGDHQDVELELNNEKKEGHNYHKTNRREQQKDKHFKLGPKLWIKEQKIIGQMMPTQELI